MSNDTINSEHLFHFRRLYGIQESLDHCLKFALNSGDGNSLQNYDDMYKATTAEISKIVLVLTDKEKDILSNNYKRMYQKYQDIL